MTQPRAYTTLMFQSLVPTTSAVMSPILNDLRADGIRVNQACMLTSGSYRSLSFVPVFVFSDRVRDYLSEVSPGFSEYEIYEDRSNIPNIQAIARYLNRGGFESLYLIPEDQREVMIALDPLDDAVDLVQETLDAIPVNAAIGNWILKDIRELGLISWTQPVRRSQGAVSGLLDELAEYRGALIPAGIWMVHCETEVQVLLAIWPNDLKYVERVFGAQIDAGEVTARMMPAVILEQDVLSEESAISVWTAAEQLFEEVGPYDDLFAHVLSCPTNGYTAALAYGKRV